MSLQALKLAIEKECGIAAWSPSPEQLQEIANRIALSRPADPEKARRIISGVYPNALRRLDEGVDNADLRTLLALAMAAASSGPK